MVPPSPQGRTGSALIFSNFVDEKREMVKRKTWHFCWLEIKVATQGVSL
jgi:hypothetical protein